MEVRPLDERGKVELKNALNLLIRPTDDRWTLARSFLNFPEEVAVIFTSGRLNKYELKNHEQTVALWGCEIHFHDIKDTIDPFRTKMYFVMRKEACVDPDEKTGDKEDR